MTEAREPYKPPQLSGPYSLTDDGADRLAGMLGADVRPTLNEAIVMARSGGRYIIPTGDVEALDAMLDAVLPVVAPMLAQARAAGAAEVWSRYSRQYGGERRAGMMSATKEAGMGGSSDGGGFGGDGGGGDGSGGGFWPGGGGSNGG